MLSIELKNLLVKEKKELEKKLEVNEIILIEKKNEANRYYHICHDLQESITAIEVVINTDQNNEYEDE